MRESITPLFHSDVKIEVEKCPECSSLFLNEGKCETCGHILLRTQMKGLYGESSFYEIYSTDRVRGQARKSYLFQLKRRARVVISSLSDLKELADHKILLIELDYIIQELSCYGVSEKALIKLLTPLDEQQILNLMLKAAPEKHRALWALEVVPGLLWTRLLLWVILSFGLVFVGLSIGV